jgi:hypothetical protein
MLTTVGHQSLKSPLFEKKSYLKNEHEEDENEYTRGANTQ